jgi:O-antigen ligase
MLSKTANKYSAILFAVPLFVIFPFLYFNSTLDPETVWRCLLCAVLILPFLLRHLVSVYKQNGSQISLLKNKPILFFLIYSIITSLSLIRSLNTGDGLYEVMKVWLYFSVFIVTAKIANENKNNTDIIIKCINISGLIFCGFGCIQLVNLFYESSIFNQLFIIGAAIHSTLGTKNTFSEVLFLILPFGIYGTLTFQKSWKIISILNSFIILCFLALLMNLYVWFAFVAAGSAMIFVKAYGKTKLKFLVFAFIGVIALAVIVLVAIPESSSIGSKLNNVLSYFKHPESIGVHDIKRNDNNIHERLVLAKNTFQLIKEHLIAGAGISNWKIYEPKYGMVSMTSNIRVDYPHNDYLSLFSETGIGGVVFYILFLVYTAKVLLNSFRRNEGKERYLNLLLFGTVIGFMMFSFFSFSKEKFFPMLLMMVISGLSMNHFSEEERSFGAFTKKVVFSFVFFSVALLCFICVKRIIAETHLQQSLKERKFQQWQEAAIEAKKAYSFFYPLDYSATPVEWYEGMAYYYAEKTDSALFHLKRAEKVNPYHVQLLNDIATCYENKGDHKNSILYYEKAFAIDPYLVRSNLVAAYFNAGNIDKAYDLSCDTKFGKTVFLEEILREKVLKLYREHKNDEKGAFLFRNSAKSGWLMHVFESVRAGNKSFEEVALSGK